MHYNAGKNHPMWGKKHPSETIAKMKIAQLGKKHPGWKGDDVSYLCLHKYIKRHYPKPELCEDCQKRRARDLACITGIYNRDLDNWRWLCKSCHMKRDFKAGMKHIKRIKNILNPQCTNCGSKTTYIRKDTGKPMWRYIDEKLVCANCHNKLRRYRRNYLPSNA